MAPSSKPKNEKAVEINSLTRSFSTRPEGFEPPATGFEVRCSIQLSYGRIPRIVAERGTHVMVQHRRTSQSTCFIHSPAAMNSLPYATTIMEGSPSGVRHAVQARLYLYAFKAALAEMTSVTEFPAEIEKCVLVD